MIREVSSLLGRKKGVDPATAVIFLIILFLIAKFLGITKAYLKIDPFGLEPEIVWGAMATAIGVLYKEIRDLRRSLNDQIEKFNSKLSDHGEKIAKLEAKMERFNKPVF